MKTTPQSLSALPAPQSTASRQAGLPAPHAIAACAFALTAGNEIQLLPAGEFRALDGRPKDAPCWLTNAAIAKNLIADINARSNPLVIDYEHQTLLSADNGQPAPAAGWFKELRWEDAAGLFAVVEWTERAAAHIAAGEYKFISPVIAYDKATGEVKKIINAALTNNPAIDGMEAVSVRLSLTLNPQEKLNMDIEDLLEDLRWMLNLPKLATAEEVIAELQKAVSLIKAGNSADAVAANTLGIAGLIQARNAEITALRSELSALKASSLDKEVNDLVAAALAEHRIAPAQKDAMLKLGKTDVALLKNILEAAVPVAAKGEAAPVDQGNGNKAAYQVMPGYSVDAASMEIHDKAIAYLRAHPDLDYFSAVQAVS